MSFFKTRATLKYSLRGQDVNLYLLPLNKADSVSLLFRRIMNPDGTPREASIEEQDSVMRDMQIALSENSDIPLEAIQDPEFGLTPAELASAMVKLLQASNDPKALNQSGTETQ